MTINVQSDVSHDGLSDAAAQAMLFQMIDGAYLTQAVYVAAKLKIADLLADGSKTIAQLAALSGTHAPSLYRLLRLLASLGVFAEQPDHSFGRTALGDLLRSDVRASVRPFALLEGDPYWWRSKGELLHCVQTGQPAPPHLNGTGEWEYLRQHPETAAVFNDAMTAMTQEETPAILDAYDFSPIHRLVDVGGGHGALLAALLRTYPGMHGILFDQPDVVSHALPLLQANGVSNRCETIGGDLFGEMPDCSDGYLLKLILHDWDDEHAAQILANLRRSMSRTARLLLVEHVIVPGNDPQPGKGLDLAMLAYVGGRERTAAEWEDLLQATGFTLTRIVPTQAALSILEAAPR